MSKPLTAPADQRTVAARRLRDLRAAYLSDLGGLPAVSTAEHSLIKRATSLEVQLELIELSWLDAGQATPESLDLFSRVAGNLRRLLTEIGLQRRAKDVTTLDAYLKTT